jgi:hypothetical protein
MLPVLFSVLAVVGGAKLVASATSGSFNILTMNVAGLPAILQSNDVPGDKATNAGTIGSYFAKYSYDVINVQEVSTQDIFLSLFFSRPLRNEITLLT